MPDFTSRASAVERLDQAAHADAALHTALRHLVGVNRWLGGIRVIRKHLAAHIATGTARMLDVGTGAADIPRHLVRWGASRGRTLRVVAIDRQRQIAKLARDRFPADPPIALAVGDGRYLPFASASFDAAVSSMALHHLDDDAARTFVSELARVARGVVIVNDLERHPVNYVAARILARTVWRRDPYTSHDGPVSVLRSYTRLELLGIGRAAGLCNARVHRHFPYRLALVGHPSVSEP